MAGDERPAGVIGPGRSGEVSADGPALHHLRTAAGLVSLSWDPDQGAFVAERGQQTWSDPRLGDLARTIGISVPAGIARELRRDERLHPGPRVQIRPAYNPSQPVTPVVVDEPSVPAQPAEGPEWPPANTCVVPSRHGQVAVAWHHGQRCFVAGTASGDRWRAEHLDDLAVTVGARMPRAYVEELLHVAGRILPVWDPPVPEPGADWTEWRPAPVEVPAVLNGLPPGVADELKPAVTAPSQDEPGGQARVETARRAVRAEWGAWTHEANARCELIEDLDAVMHGLARGDLLHQAMERLERMTERFRRQVEVEQTPTVGALAREGQPVTPTTSATAAINRLNALRSRPALALDALERS
jgi:hypothetical protein